MVSIELWKPDNPGRHAAAQWLTIPRNTPARKPNLLDQTRDLLRARYSLDPYGGASGISAGVVGWAIKRLGGPDVISPRVMICPHPGTQMPASVQGLLNYFDYPITNAASESINSRIQALKANARGFRAFDNYRNRILFFLGASNGSRSPE